MSEKVEYLGHQIDSEVLHTMASMAPQPRKIQELRSILGLLHY